MKAQLITTVISSTLSYYIFREQEARDWSGRGISERKVGGGQLKGQGKQLWSLTLLTVPGLWGDLTTWLICNKSSHCAYIYKGRIHLRKLLHTKVTCIWNTGGLMNRLNLLKRRGWAFSAGYKATSQLLVLTPNSVAITKSWLASSGQKASSMHLQYRLAHEIQKHLSTVINTGSCRNLGAPGPPDLCFYTFYIFCTGKAGLGQVWGHGHPNIKISLYYFSTSWSLCRAPSDLLWTLYLWDQVYATSLKPLLRTMRASHASCTSLPAAFAPPRFVPRMTLFSLRRERSPFIPKVRPSARSMLTSFLRNMGKCNQEAEAESPSIPKVKLLPQSNNKDLGSIYALDFHVPPTGIHNMLLSFLPNSIL